MVNEPYPPEFNMIFFPSKHQDAKMSVYTVCTLYISGWRIYTSVFSPKYESPFKKWEKVQGARNAVSLLFFRNLQENCEVKTNFYLHVHKNSKEMDEI